MMKKIIYTILSITMLTACKKETTQANNTNNSNNNTNTCIDNPNINFISIGTPVGKFGDCIKDIDGNSYKTVTIGSQTWMAENLKVTKYNDGTAIPNVTIIDQWKKNTTGAWCNYNNSDSLGKIYGKLYNWYAVSPSSNGNKDICPTGWHVPTDSEWLILTEYLGGNEIAGNKMKEVGVKNWKNSINNATNISLFSGLPGGNCGGKNGYDDLGIFGEWWSANEYNNYNSWSMGLYVLESKTYKQFSGKENGVSVRCIQD